MRLTIESTSIGVDIGFGVARMWRGTDDKGNRFPVMVLGIGAKDDAAKEALNNVRAEIGISDSLEIVSMEEATARLFAQ